MADALLSLPLAGRREVLDSAFGRGLVRSPALLEKDVWVVWALQALVAAPFAGDLVFKGGTSLSKAYHVIQRFSEDVGAP
jgi:predicted nucleotidyltransferase component of viral defense system